MRRDATIDLDILFARFADELLHPLDYPAALVLRSEPDDRDVSSYVLTRAGDELFRLWLHDQGLITFVDVDGHLALCRTLSPRGSGYRGEASPP